MLSLSLEEAAIKKMGGRRRVFMQFKIILMEFYSSSYLHMQEASSRRHLEFIEFLKFYKVIFHTAPSAAVGVLICRANKVCEM